MKEEIVSWDRFKEKISDHIKRELGPRICRGQSNIDWPLRTSFHRNTNNITMSDYFKIVKHLSDVIGCIENRRVNLEKDEEVASFTAYLQHHGFPTPLLDWSTSPYIAAFFAYEDYVQQGEYVSVYVFNYLKWIKDWIQIYNYDIQEPHVTILTPKAHDNIRQITQQSYSYMFTNVDNITQHIISLEQIKKEEYLEKYLLPSSERTYVMTDLESMNITKYSLFRTTDSLLSSLKETIFYRKIQGDNPIDYIRKFGS